MYRLRGFAPRNSSSHLRSVAPGLWVAEADRPPPGPIDINDDHFFDTPDIFDNPLLCHRADDSLANSEDDQSLQQTQAFPAVGGHAMQDVSSKDAVLTAVLNMMETLRSPSTSELAAPGFSMLEEQRRRYGLVSTLGQPYFDPFASAFPNRNLGLNVTGLSSTDQDFLMVFMRRKRRQLALRMERLSSPPEKGVE